MEKAISVWVRARGAVYRRRCGSGALLRAIDSQLDYMADPSDRYAPETRHPLGSQGTLYRDGMVYASVISTWVVECARVDGETHWTWYVPSEKEAIRKCRALAVFITRWRAVYISKDKRPNDAGVSYSALGTRGQWHDVRYGATDYDILA